MPRTKVFISYSHKDERSLKRLSVHLQPLVRDSDIAVWHDKQINPGDEWREKIKTAIHSARVVVLLVSADFLASDFIARDELPPLLDAAKNEGVIILPVILSQSQFDMNKRLSQFQAVNDPTRPLNLMSPGNREKVWDKVARSVYFALKESPIPPFDQTVIRQQVLNLSREYEDIRKIMPAGSERTKKMEDVILKIKPLALAARPLLPELVRSSSVGEQLAAIAILQEQPDLKHLEWLLQRTAEDPGSFHGYHAAQAWFQAVRVLGPFDREALQKAIEEVKTSASAETKGAEAFKVLGRAEMYLREIGNQAKQ
jgi:hypothetical protein